MKHSVRHDLDLTLACTAVKTALEGYAERFKDYSPRVHWRNDIQADIGFTAKGVKLDGSVEVNGSEILIDLKVPFLLKVFKGKAIQVIEKEIKIWIGKAKAGELE